MHCNVFMSSYLNKFYDAAVESWRNLKLFLVEFCFSIKIRFHCVSAAKVHLVSFQLNPNEVGTKVTKVSFFLFGNNCPTPGLGNKSLAKKKKHQRKRLSCGDRDVDREIRHCNYFLKFSWQMWKWQEAVLSALHMSPYIVLGNVEENEILHNQYFT